MVKARVRALTGRLPPCSVPGRLAARARGGRPFPRGRGEVCHERMYLSVPILAAALAGVAALSASRRLHRLRAVWHWLGIGCLLWAAGATASAILTSGSDSTDWPVHIAWIA